MHELYELKDMLMKELEEYGAKGELSTGALDVVDKLTHTLKNLCKIIDEYDDGGSSRMYPRHYPSYARTGRRRDSMGRYAGERGYSRDGDMVQELRDLMRDAPDEHTRKEFERFISKIESA